MLCIKAISAVGFASIFALVVQSQKTPNVQCQRNVPQTLDANDCLSALHKFTASGDAITFAPLGNSHCQGTCNVTLSQVVGSGSEVQGIPKSEGEETIRASLKNCGRVGLTAIFGYSTGISASLQLNDVTNRCGE